MSYYQPSDTYKLLYDYIIDDLLFQICTSNMGYCVRDKNIPFILGEKFDKYRNRALENMSGTRLDRHKLASCICGAIIEVRPLTGIHGKIIKKNANEILALAVGLNVIKSYMMCKLLYEIDNETYKYNALRHLKEKFDMQFPSIENNICDTQEYRKNIENSLLWSHHICDLSKRECFHYDGSILKFV